ncbi:MAG TPA: hypothetical protein DEF02_03590 [Clostridiales bacterium]|nr:hypothetical protein [Clostridiales bacterium]
MAKSVDKNLKKLPLGAIRPQGWLLDQMRFASNLQKRIGSLSGLVKDGEWNGGESLPRYVRGLILLSCALDDKNLKEKVSSFMSLIFASANEGGDFGPKNTSSLTPKIEAVKTLLTYYEATDNERVLPFLKKFFKSQFNTYSVSSSWYDSRARLLEEIGAIEAVYRETDLEWLQDLGEKLRDSSNDWFKLANRFPYKKPYQRYISQTVLKRIQKQVLSVDCAKDGAKKHKTLSPEYVNNQWHKKKHKVAVETSGVNLAKAIKYPAVYGRFIGDDNLKNLSLKLVCALEKRHGTPLGMFSCTPRIAGAKGVGAVDVEAGVEMLESLVEVVKETRSYELADLIERIVFNMVAGASFDDCSAVQDMVFVNQTEASQTRKLPYADEDNAFYTKKASRGAIALLSAYPLFLQTACMVKDEQLNFITYAPCTMDVSVGGCNLTISERTGYPFRNAVVFKVEQADGEPEVKINFRVPKNTYMQLISGGQIVASGSKEISVKCILKAGSTFMLKMNIPLTVEGNADGSRSLFKGNLLMALKLPCDVAQDSSDRRTLIVKCSKKWNIAPLLSKKSTKKLFEDERVVVHDISGVPFAEEQPPFELKIRSKNVLNWDYDTSGFESFPKKCSFSEESMERTYVPFGCTLTRMAKFPKCLK